MKTNHLHFPQWQGAGNALDLKTSSDFLYESLKAKFDWTSIEVQSNDNLNIENQIYGYSAIINHLKQAAELLNQSNPDRIFTLGGDCGVEIAPVSYLNNKHDNLGVIWFDAHGDLNTPSSSPSKYFHGMPLRHLLGEGDLNILSFSSTISAENTVLVGVRNLDNPEADFIKEKGIKVVNSVENLHLALESIGKVYVHIDLDVLNSSEFPYTQCPEVGGFSYDQLIGFLEEIKARYKIVGGSIVEYNSNKGEGLEKVIKLTDFWE